MQITGNTLFIPGATSGIGLGLALRFQALGNTVVIGGRRTELLDELVAGHPGLDAVQIDTTDPDSIAEAFRTVTGRHPELNVVIAMAGVMQAENLRDPAFLATAERTITTNLLGPIRLLAAFEPWLEQARNPVFMTVSSGLAFVPLPATPTYSATKAAIHSFTESLRVQLAGTPVQVLELVPPAVQTDLMPGQAESPTAMPLEAFLDEVMLLIETQPDAAEILVENVGFLRNAVANGSYPRVLGMLAGAER
ncbi:SDR family oxidoreductase [Herbiconiux daphne]|uniref:SDR family NAD(P)-dependent oxidoreductase n=1 Tax=Herbiconiux daphne TaxID=2970914 RepID=A0ABT2H7U7_9MICO|nr:SDR family NAD(P)-dependent oxidoreductase [Herbiconiux daphne]MCS5735994.1 SDR family NAD(P)-dependent oxidoreductase [Herbiconiux daphne]